MRVSISRVEQNGKITLQESGGIAIVTIHRPEYKNAMTANMWKELAQIGKRIPKNQKTRVVILRGAEGLFTAGSDIKEFNRITIDEANEAFGYMEEAISAFEQIELPTIGVISGPAMGAGFELALACDLRVGTPHTKMGMPIGRLGITLSKPFVKRIVDLIGPSKMKDLVYTGRILTPEECEDWGLVNYLLTEEDNPDSFAVSLANKIKEQSPASLFAVKESAAFANPRFDIPLKSKFEKSAHPIDFPEGVRAFVEKRKPNFKSR
ncbi:enoyl-CoA hydratase/isomerase family protein [Alteribacillus iranensis]|uniref:Enoyl-CoA hydratase/carnithine racemase n=1 Tax=Alteribacillus iranensis TaxID=930128 RepID=A0A1I2DMM7_9BACI|nr:enoyl-CoA hydratase-related protein [Alteribacillus iranensis]SFE81825.1 Enoyl-CoA hydratase/carnithine racemase [Alteribacillus iranensis]